MDSPDRQNEILEFKNENTLHSHIVNEKDSVLKVYSDSDKMDTKKAIDDKLIESDFEMPEI